MSAIITMNIVRDSVMNTLGKYFSDFEIYGEENPQDFSASCFFVKLLNVDQKQELGNRYRRSYFFDIHFYPEDKKIRTMHEMAEQLYELLEVIDIDQDLQRGIGMKHEIIDDVLHFFVHYNFIVRKVELDESKMQDLNVEEGLVNG
ncbi:phage tail terminator family protein [Heyndrickxia sporothermodurans]